MDLLVCGSGAAEGWPAVFCSCGPCAGARRRGGKDLRSRTGYMLGDKIRIDLSPDSHSHQLRFGLDYSRLEALLISHAHEDHWLPYELYYRQPGFSKVPESALLAVYGNAMVQERLVAQIGADEERFRYRFHRAAAFAPIQLPDDVSAYPIPADHDARQECFNYLLEVELSASRRVDEWTSERSGRSPSTGPFVDSSTPREEPMARLLIGHDTGWYEEPSWDFLRGKPLDVVLLDCTGGPQGTRRGHMSCAVVCEFRDRLREQGSLAPEARVIATHFSHNGGWLHEELEAYLTPRGIEVSYDGMSVPVVP